MDTRDHKTSGPQQNTWNKTAPPTSTGNASKPNIRVARDAAPNSSSGSSIAIPSFIAPVGQKQAQPSATLDEDSDLSPSNENSESESSSTSDSGSQHSGGDRDNGATGLPTTRRPLKLAEESDTNSTQPANPEVHRHVAASNFYGAASRRRATRNVVTYCEVAQESSEEGSPPARSRGERSGGRRDSDSDFVMSEGERGPREASGSSSEEDEEEEEDESEEEYRPKYKKKTTSARKSKVGFIYLRTSLIIHAERRVVFYLRSATFYERKILRG